MFIQVLQSERLKLRNSKVTFIVVAAPVLAFVIGLFASVEMGAGEWLNPVTPMILAHSALFLPLLTGVLAAQICRHEHASGGWKQTLVLPVPRIQVYIAKFVIAGPSVVNVMLTLPAIVIANSELLGPLYPWAHPVLGMTQALSYSLGGDAGFLASATVFYTIMTISFLVFTACGTVYFQKKEWT